MNRTGPLLVAVGGALGLFPDVLSLLFGYDRLLDSTLLSLFGGVLTLGGSVLLVRELFSKET
ncbi:hypothetical protein [Halorussus amylolyticus]|uniref:hypothetical protein n=1 Tax=Halorussus amylolyticus TaxID=1126242 RepID=UPI00104DD56A|nr:hypothetical protein [Halorussus amylolyticus]